MQSHFTRVHAIRWIRGAACSALLFAAATAPAYAGDSTTPMVVQDESMAMVRVVHLSPNTPNLSVHLTRPDQDDVRVAPDAFQSLEYKDQTEYEAIPEGGYVLRVTDEAGVALVEREIGLQAGTHHTVAIEGLTIPGEAAEAEEDPDGFIGWLDDILGGGGDRDALDLRATVYEDEAVELADGERRVRFVNAAPASPDFDVVAVRADGSRDVIVDLLPYGEVADYVVLDPEVVGLELSVADSDLLVVDLSEHIQAGGSQTIFVTGTEFEGVPLGVMVLEDPQPPAQQG